MKIISLASGSSGNSLLVQANGSAILVDAGISAKRIAERLEQAGSDPASIHAIVVSHGHSDHIKGVGVLSRKHKIPVWMNRGTYDAVKQYIGKIHELRFFQTGKVFEVSGFRIHPFSVPHDCVDPVGFRISRGSSRLGVATDLGSVTGLVTNLLQGVQVAVLESNHDPKMLIDGPYPWELKQRVKGRLGHLSNSQSAGLLQRIFSDELQAVLLAHVSETNNLPELALACARDALGEFVAQNGLLCCASQHQVGPEIEW
ncbi:MAG: MBL fold metallo-hydrolase [Deltaproteobacteria bacterium]|nr:MBL fold metallo-hydrolase [Deltaproteobacteria bacterium]